MKCLIFFFNLLMLIGCHIENNQQVDQKKVQEEIKQHQIQKISEADIFEAAQALAENMMTDLEQMILDSITSRYILPTNSPFNAKSDFNLISQSFQSKIFEVIEYVSYKAEDSLDLNDPRLQLLDAYKYNIENEFPLENNLMNDGTTHLIFTKALHPSITDWLASDRLEVENSNTSELKEFAGFWYVRISKKQLILTL